jgi:hypothetical protein
VQVEAGAEVSSNAGKDNDARLCGLFDSLNLQSQLASQSRSECVSPSGAVERQPVNRTTGLREEFAGHEVLVLGMCSPGFYRDGDFRIVLYEEAGIHTRGSPARFTLLGFHAAH